MQVTCEVVPNTRTMNGLKRLPDKVVWNVARNTLDMARSIEIIPKDTGRLRTSSMAGGVRGGNGNYYIGSYTDYASYVWNMPSSTNWTVPASNNKWYARVLERHGAVITNNAINQGWKDTM